MIARSLQELKQAWKDLHWKLQREHSPADTLTLNSGLQSFERINHRCFKPCMVWYFIMAVLGSLFPVFLLAQHRGRCPFTFCPEHQPFPRDQQAGEASVVPGPKTGPIL